MTPKIAFTIGYEGVDVDDMARAAKAAGVTTIVDTRRNPTSRRPAFRQKALRAALLSHGVGYESRPSLGVPARIRPLAQSRPWMFQAAYRGIINRAEHAGELDATLATMRDETVALLCFEAEAGQCHRSLLADAITARAPFTFINLYVRRV